MNGFCRVALGDTLVSGVRDGTTFRPVRGGLLGSWEPDAVALHADALPLAAPLAPSRVFGVGRNFPAAFDDGVAPSEPAMFLKGTWSVVGPDAAVLVPEGVAQLRAGAELGVIIGRHCRDVAVEDAGDVILGYTCVNDLTAADYVREAGLGRAKSLPTFCPVGPVVVRELDPGGDATITGRVNGDVAQQGRVSDMIFGVAEVVAFTSRWFPLEPGDVIAMGSPHPNPACAPGDVLEVEIDGVGVLRNPVRLRADHDVDGLAPVAR